MSLDKMRGLLKQDIQGGDKVSPDNTSQWDRTGLIEKSDVYPENTRQLG